MSKVFATFLICSQLAFGKVEGIASWYGEYFHGRTTYSGEKYDMNKLTAASNRYKMGTYVKVTNKANGNSVVVKINDTGAFTKKYGREIDLSKAAFAKLDKLKRGLIDVVIEEI